jgi:tRNA 5-methylaminomethyl-2-thiouridine biosynthesis bifunctional protein
VFLAPADFRGLLDSRQTVVVGELGFGTGLNLAVIARHCLARSVRLHFISFEAAPIAADDFRRIASARQAAEPAYAELASLYPPLLAGWHHRSLAGGRIRLSLYFGTAEAGLADLNRQPTPVDLWLLDGFAPDRNPDMWSDELLAAIGRTAGRGTRVTTFTAAGRVRRGLVAAGFDMRRVDQRPHKRESLAGTFTAEGPARQDIADRVTVAGAGIAGATVARELVSQGIPVRVMEAANEPATGASSIPATVMHPRLHHDGSDPAELKAVAYAHAVAATRGMAADGGYGLRRTGALQIPSPNFPAERLAAVAERYGRTGLGVELVEERAARELAGDPVLQLAGPALWFPDACSVDTPAFTRMLLDHPEIEVVTGAALEDWPDEPTVLACGMASRAFAGAAFLELGSVTGQLDLIKRGNSALKKLTVPITGRGYLAPIDDATIGVGATYEYEPWPAEKATAANLAHVQRILEERLAPSASNYGVDYRKAIRCVSSDRNPVVGPLTDQAGNQDVNRLVSVGHGSMGTVTSHLAATLIAATLTGQFEPLTDRLLALVTSRRFRERQKRRGYRFGAEP